VLSALGTAFAATRFGQVLPAILEFVAHAAPDFSQELFTVANTQPSYDRQGGSGAG